MKSKRTNASIDLAKLIGSIMIYSMHIHAFRDFGSLQNYWEVLSRWGVPFFFIASAFFLYRKKTNHSQISLKEINQYAMRIGFLYLGWFLINLPSIWFFKFRTSGLSDLNTWKTFFMNLITGSTFTGSWYLLSCIASAYLVYLLAKFLPDPVLAIIGIFFQAINAFSSVYWGLVPTEFRNIINLFCFPYGILGGVSYFCFGMLFARHEEAIRKLHAPFCFWTAAFFYCLYIAEIYFSRNAGLYACSDQSFFIAVTGCLLFLGCLNSRLQLRNTRLLRKMSVIIYCAQANILMIFRHIIPASGYDVGFTLYLMANLAMAGIIILILWLQKKEVRFASYLT